MSDHIERLRDAIQVVLFFSARPPVTVEDNRERDEAIVAIRELTQSKGLNIPGKASTVWLHQLRKKAFRLASTMLSLQEKAQLACWLKEAQDELWAVVDTRATAVPADEPHAYPSTVPGGKAQINEAEQSETRINLGPAVEKLVTLIRWYISLDGEAFPVELPVKNLMGAVSNPVAGATVTECCRDLLEYNRIPGGLDDAIRDARPWMREAASELHLISHQLAQADKTEYVRFRVLWDEFLSSPLFQWRWDGPSDSTSSRVEVRVKPMEPSLLEELKTAATQDFYARLAKPLVLDTREALSAEISDALRRLGAGDMPRVWTNRTRVPWLRADGAPIPDIQYLWETAMRLGIAAPPFPGEPETWDAAQRALVCLQRAVQTTATADELEQPMSARELLVKYRVKGRKNPCLAPNWPPIGFKGYYCPADDSLGALRDWFTYLVKPDFGVMHWLGAQGQKVEDLLRDTWLLIHYHREKGTITLSNNIETTHADVFEAIAEVTRVRDAIFPKAQSRSRSAGNNGGRLPVPKHADKDNYIQAKLCRNDRIKSHKQLKALLEKENIRSELRGQHLWVHAADWQRWNAEQDRLAFNALDWQATEIEKAMAKKGKKK